MGHSDGTLRAAPDRFPRHLLPLPPTVLARQHADTAATTTAHLPMLDTCRSGIGHLTGLDRNSARDGLACSIHDLPGAAVARAELRPSVGALTMPAPITPGAFPRISWPAATALPGIGEPNRPPSPTRRSRSGAGHERASSGLLCRWRPSAHGNGASPRAGGTGRLGTSV